MIVGYLETERYTFQTIATTEDKARAQLAQGFTAHIVQRAGGTAAEAREHFCAEWDREDTLDDDSFVALLDEVYGMRLVDLKPGRQVVRDFDYVLALDTR